jgi:hypothetical protein
MIEHQVLGFHIAMQDSVSVRILQTRRRGQRRRDRRLDTHPGGAPFLERAACQKLHNEHAQVTLLSVVVHGNDMRVVDLRQDPRFAAEARAVFSRVGLRDGELFDRDFSAELAVASTPNDPELTPAHLVADLVVGKCAGDVLWGAHRLNLDLDRRSTSATLARRGGG